MLESKDYLGSSPTEDLRDVNDDEDAAELADLA
jgi:hypothetical protein